MAGRSGCGKSTLASILSGVQPGYQGSVQINGVELRSAEPGSLRRLVTVVSSNSYLFSGSVRATLLEASRTRIRRSCAAYCAG